MQRKCKICNTVLELNCDNFRKNKSCIGGFSPRCKVCYMPLVASVRNSKKGLTLRIFDHQKENSKRRGHLPPSYTLKELREWIYSQANFEALFNSWVLSGYKKNLIPSCDRIDDYQPYSLGNLQLVTWGDNNRDGNKSIRSGMNNKLSKAVVKLAKDGRFVESYYSVSEAARRTGVRDSNICKCCKGVYGFKTAGGYRWKYADSAL